MTDVNLPPGGQIAESMGRTVTLRFEGDRVEGQVIISMLETLNRALRQDEEQEVRTICAAMNLPNFVSDAALYRLNGDEPRYYVTVARPGSVELLISIVTVTYFVVERTLGESIKAGYLESKTHEQLKRLTSSIIDNKIARLAYNLRSPYGGPTMIVKVEDDLRSIQIDVAKDPKKLADQSDKLSDILRELDREN